MLTRPETYDEEDDGFVFTRASKRTKTAPAKLEPVPATTTPAPATAKRGRKPKESKVRDDEPTATEKKSSGRRMSFSTPKAEADNLAIPKKRKTTRSSTGKAGNSNETSNASRVRTTGEDDLHRNGTEAMPEVDSSMNGTKGGTIIALPFSDTPIINRNKEMRKNGGNGVRRSSLGLRGRRASSLIDSGHSAIPHREVETSEFYKHIEGQLAEPRRMKQLLTWTGERCLAGEGKEKELGDPNRAAAKAGMIACLYFCKVES